MTHGRPVAIVDPAQVRAELVARAAQLQAVLGDPDTAEQNARIRTVDTENTAWLAGVVAVHGWPSRRLVSADGAHAAVRLAERVPRPYLAGWLLKIRDAVGRRDLSRHHLDRLEAWFATPRPLAWPAEL